MSSISIQQLSGYDTGPLSSLIDLEFGNMLQEIRSMKIWFAIDGAQRGKRETFA